MVKKPEIIVFAGPNGSGKSTIARMAKIIPPYINADRVMVRAASGGHDVPVEKIFSRYEKACKLLPELIGISDICHIYDNSISPFRIFKKRKKEYFCWENELWNKKLITELTQVFDVKQRT